MAAVLAASIVVIGGAVTFGIRQQARAGTALDLGEGEHNLCIPAPKASSSGNTIVGDAYVRNSSKVPVEIVSVSLVEPDGLALRESLLVPVLDGEDGVGVRHADNPAPLPKAWGSRRATAGTILEPGVKWNLVVVVNSRGQEGDIAAAQGARVLYRIPTGRMYHQDTVTSILVSGISCDEALKLY
jgi:hypothetical protein